jgi:hypothetical protein
MSGVPFWDNFRPVWAGGAMSRAIVLRNLPCRYNGHDLPQPQVETSGSCLFGFFLGQQLEQQRSLGRIGFQFKRMPVALDVLAVD